MLIESFAVFLWYSIAVHDVESDDPQLVAGTGDRGRTQISETQNAHSIQRASRYLTEWSSRRGTISSTNVLGVLPSGV
jgi:hypothetical protein